MGYSGSSSSWSSLQDLKIIWERLQLGIKPKMCVIVSLPAHYEVLWSDILMQQLKAALERVYPGQWELNEGDGAFYGPKIDITIKDALKRSFQCATIQLDFQLPEQFNLKYRGPDDFEGSADKAPSRPVMVHRAILGSLERFIAIITEHFAGKWYVPQIKWKSMIS